MQLLDWKIYSIEHVQPHYGATVHAQVALDHLLSDERFDKVEERFLREFGMSAYLFLSNTLKCLIDPASCNEAKYLVSANAEGAISMKVSNQSGLDLYIFDSIPSLTVDEDAGVFIMAEKLETQQDLLNAFVRADGRRRFFCL